MNPQDHEQDPELEQDLDNAFEDEMEVVYVGGPSEEAEKEGEDEEEEIQYAVRPNKSQLKRDMQALQDLGDKLTGLKDDVLEGFGFTERTLAAIVECRKIRKGGARNRQLKYIAKRLSAEDTTAASAHFDEMKSRQLAENRHFHQLEQLRDRLIAEGDQFLGELLDEHRDLDRQQLRQLVRAGKKEQETGKPAGAGRKLFRYLRESLER